MKNKKGFELQALVGIGITFLVIAIVLSFGGTILGKLITDQSSTSTVWVYNETVSSLGNDTRTALGQGWGLIDISWVQTGAYMSNESVSSVANTTDIIIYNDGYAAITDTHALAGWGNDTNLNVTYSYTYTEAASDYNATASGISSVEEFSSWLPTLAIIIVAAIIIGIIMRYFMPFTGVRY